MNDKLLKALRAENRGRPPVWLMRQAGRYLPSYQKLRANHSLRELFFTPELAAEVTLLPVELGVDAVILFSDITVTALCLGLELDFSEGPVIQPQVSPDTELKSIDPEIALKPVFEAIRLAKQDLEIPFIGFCGAPFTVASYLIEKHKGTHFPKTMHWMKTDPKSFHRFLHQINTLTRRYLELQIEAGAGAVQIFDSWANVLSKEEFEEFSLPYLKELAENLSVPSIVFSRGKHAEEIAQLPVGISVDWTSSLPLLRKEFGRERILQGNLNPDLLFEPLDVVRKSVQDILHSMQGDPAFIFNLGHGVKPKTPVDAVRTVIDTVKAFR